LQPAVKVLVKKLPHAAHLPLPGYMTPGSSGMDLFAAIEQARELPPGTFQLIPSGIALALPPGYEGQVRPRSGLAAKHGLTLLNSPGTVDADYRGEIKMILINLGAATYKLQPGERIAQLIVTQVARAVLEERDELPPSLRGEEGFGHTGKFRK